MRKIECFKIRLLTCSSQADVWDVKALQPLYDIPYARRQWSLNPVVIVADPFLFVHKGRLYLFFEVKRNYSPGIIRMISTADLQHWTEPVTVLSEPFHLSYPFVFTDGDAVYMIPETGEVGDIRLYRADARLEHFTFERVLIHREVVEDEIGFCDTSVYRKDGVCYLLTSVERERKNYLHLFTASRLEGPYTEHPCSPVSVSANYGRNAGCLLAGDDGKLYRVAQDCEHRYGDNVHLLQVDRMTQDDYGEHVVRQYLLPADHPFYQEGGHQYNYVDFNGRRIVATDAKEYHALTPYRLLHKTGLGVGQLFKKMLPA